MCGLPVLVKFRHFEVETGPTLLLAMQHNLRLTRNFINSLIEHTQNHPIKLRFT